MLPALTRIHPLSDNRSGIALHIEVTDCMSNELWYLKAFYSDKSDIAILVGSGEQYVGRWSATELKDCFTVRTRETRYEWLEIDWKMKNTMSQSNLKERFLSCVKYG